MCPECQAQPVSKIFGRFFLNDDFTFRGWGVKVFLQTDKYTAFLLLSLTMIYCFGIEVSNFETFVIEYYSISIIINKCLKFNQKGNLY